MKITAKKKVYPYCCKNKCNPTIRIIPLLIFFIESKTTAMLSMKLFKTTKVLMTLKKKLEGYNSLDVYQFHKSLKG